MTLANYLTTRSDRCTCGFHVPTQGCHCEGGEWSTFKAAVLSVVSSDGRVHQSKVRPLIRGRIEPKHVGQMYRRAKSEGLLVDTGEREQSNDVAGRNSDKLDRIYALGRAA